MQPAHTLIKPLLATPVALALCYSRGVRIVQLDFVAGALQAQWSDRATLDEFDVTRRAAPFRGSVKTWIVPTYLRLREPLAAPECSRRSAICRID